MQPKLLKSIRVEKEYGRECEFAELIKDGEDNILRYWYNSMEVPRKLMFADFESAEMQFLKTAMFILSE